jgi:RecB family exonuclease
MPTMMRLMCATYTCAAGAPGAIFNHSREITVDRTLADAFVSDVDTWKRTEDEAALMHALRSPYSGVPHDVAAAYAVVAARSGPLLDAIAHERLALPAEEREAVFTFAERMRKILDGAEIASLFALGASNPSASGTSDGAFALAAPVLPEPRSPVRARQQHFSASALNTYAECARKWYYRYVCAAVEDRPSSASTYGTAFHAALEDFHADFPHPRLELEPQMREMLERHIKAAFQRFREEFATEVEAELQERRARRTARRYIDWLLVQARRSPFTVIGRELPATLDLDGYAFVGFIDRLDRDDATGHVSIFDYKTGSIAASAAEYRDKVRAFREFQLPFYYWARTAAGDRISRLALIPLKDALLDVRPVTLEIVVDGPPETARSDAAEGTITIRELERARSRMVEICRKLTSGEMEYFPVTSDPAACTYCVYATACADRPHDERERFGR